MSRRRIALGLAAGLACFGLGLGAARFLGAPPAHAPSPAVEPVIVFDPASIKLLPDASLRLDLPSGIDAGLP
jgi:hypothetical protein